MGKASGRTEITVALIGVVGAVLAALITIWPQTFGDRSKDASASEPIRHRSEPPSAITTEVQLPMPLTGAGELIVSAGETKTLPGGQYAFSTLRIERGAKLIVTGGVVIVTGRLAAEEQAAIEYQGHANTQELISISALDASGLQFLYINASGKAGMNGPDGGPGPKGRDAYAVGHNLRYPSGRSSGTGGAGSGGGSGEAGQPAANVSLYLPNLRATSLLRVHAIGGSGGAGGTGGSGGQGGEGAAGHPASNGGVGGPGGPGGGAGSAGKISVSLVVADSTNERDQEAALKTLRLEYSNSAGTPGAGGAGGLAGTGGRGAFMGGDGSGGSRGSLGLGGGQGSVGEGPASNPDQRWVVTNVLTQSQYAQQVTQTLQAIREAMRDGTQ